LVKFTPRPIDCLGIERRQDRMAQRFLVSEHLTTERGCVSMTAKRGQPARIEWPNTY